MQITAPLAVHAHTCRPAASTKAHKAGMSTESDDSTMDRS
jgi:hypothetical protein